MRERLGAQARPVNIAQHARGVQQLRSVLPNTFGLARFVRRAAVTQVLYLLDLQDLPHTSGKSDHRH
jgi:hypothetical protein